MVSASPTRESVATIMQPLDGLGCMSLLGTSNTYPTLSKMMNIYPPQHNIPQGCWTFYYIYIYSYLRLSANGLVTSSTNCFLSSSLSFSLSLSGSMSFLWPLYMRTITRDNGKCFNPLAEPNTSLNHKENNVCFNYRLKDPDRYLWGTYPRILSECVSLICETWGNPSARYACYSVLAGKD